MDYDRDDGGSINSSLMDGEDSISEDEDAIGGWDNEEDFWDDDSIAEEESARVDAPLIRLMVLLQNMPMIPV